MKNIANIMTSDSSPYFVFCGALAFISNRMEYFGRLETVL